MNAYQLLRGSGDPVRLETMQAQLDAWSATLPDVFGPDFSVRIEFGGES